MDHTYNDFDDIQYEDTLALEELSPQDELLSKILSASDYLCNNDLENAQEVLLDIEDLSNNME